MDLQFQSPLSSARHALFVPGTRPDRFIKARTSGADVVILDLEDSVFPEDKPEALANVEEYLQSTKQDDHAPLLIRVNKGIAQAEIDRLLEAEQSNGVTVLGYMIPKVENPEDLPEIPTHLRLVPIIESSRGVLNVESVATSPKVELLAFGAMDYAAELGSTSDLALDYARMAVVLASAANCLSAPWDSPSEYITDLEAVKQESSKAKGLGFGGKLAIHPGQLAQISQAFSPSEAEIAWAKRVLAAESSAVQVDGKMVDQPIILKAKRILGQSSFLSSSF